MLTGCTQTKPDASSDVPDTLGSKLVNQFQKHAKEESDPMEIAQKIVQMILLKYLWTQKV